MKKRIIPFHLICLFYCLHGVSQVVYYPPGSTYTGLGVYSRRFTQSFSFLCNQAALGHLSQASAGVYTEKRFGLKELSFHLASAALPVKSGGIGIALQYGGFSAFNESRAALAYGKNLGRVALGVQFNYHRVYMAGYGSDAAMGFELGTLWPLTKKLVAGVQIANLMGGHFQHNEQEKLASVYRLGLGYEAAEQVCVSAQLIKEENRPLNILAGIQYNIVPNKLFTRLGVATATSTPFWGIGWQWKNYRVDVAIQYHPRLGFSPGLLLIFYGKQKSDQ